MIEIEDKDAREAFLARARGMESHVHVLVDGERVAATWDRAREHPEHLSAVMYLKFPLGAARAANVRAGSASLTLAVDHPAYTAQVALPGDLVRSLADDLE